VLFHDPFCSSSPAKVSSRYFPTDPFTADHSGRANTGIVGSNPTQGMDVCLRVFCVCVGSGLATVWSPVQGVLPIVLGLRNWSETKRFTDAVCSKVGATGKRERDLLHCSKIDKLEDIVITPINRKHTSACSPKVRSYCHLPAIFRNFSSTHNRPIRPITFLCSLIALQ
jgi:hypothetical protein